MYFSCNHCHQPLQVLETAAGKQVRCPKCQQVVIAPSPIAPGGYTAQPAQAQYQPQAGQYPGYESWGGQPPMHHPYVHVEEPPAGLSITSMVLGIVSVPGLLCWPVSVVLAILAIIFGFIGMNQGGKGMAIAGVCCGFAALAILLIILLAVGTQATMMGRFWR